MLHAAMSSGAHHTRTPAKGINFGSTSPMPNKEIVSTEYKAACPSNLRAVLAANKQQWGQARARGAPADGGAGAAAGLKV
jgi:hypothetical protein